MSQETESEILQALERGSILTHQMVRLVYYLIGFGFVLGGWNMAIQLTLSQHSQVIESLRTADIRRSDSISRIDRNVAVLGQKLGVGVEQPHTSE